MGTTIESGTALFIPYYIRSSCESEVPVPMTLGVIEAFHRRAIERRVMVYPKRIPLKHLEVVNNGFDILVFFKMLFAFQEGIKVYYACF